MLGAEELVRRLRPVVGERAHRIWQSYLASDPDERKLIEHSLENLHSQRVDDYRREKILLTPPEKHEQLDGDYPAGMVYYADKPLYPFAFLEKELQQHIGVFGRTGSGKSTFLKALLLTHFQNSKPALIFDWKGTYAELAGSDIILLEPGSDTLPFFFNPLEMDAIPSGHRKTYTRQVIELFIDCYLEDLKLLTVHGVESLLLKSIDRLSSDSRPLDFHSILAVMENYQGRARETDWKSTALNTLYKLTNGPLGNVMREKSCRMEWLADQKIIFELTNVGNSKDKSFFVRSLLLRLYYHFREEGPSSCMKLLIVIEEAHNILLKKGTGFETIVELLLRQIREFGVGICVVDQHPSLMSLPALGTYCTVAFNLRLEQDRRAMASALNLPQTEYLGKLPTRFAIVKIQDRYLEPFLIKTFPIGENVTTNPYNLTPSAIEAEQKWDLELKDAYGQSERKSGRKVRRKTSTNDSGKGEEVIQRIIRRLYEQQAIPPLHPGEIRFGADECSRLYGTMQGGRVPREERKKQETMPKYAKTGSPRYDGPSRETTANPFIPPATKEGEAAEVKEIEGSLPGFSEACRVLGEESRVLRVIRDMGKGRGKPLLWEEAFLIHICQYPLMATMERYRHLEIDKHQGHKHRNSLLGKGFIAIQPISTATARVKLMVPTETGFRWLKERGFSAGNSDKQGGFQHQYWGLRIREQFRKQGFSAELEVALGNNSAVDLVVCKGNKSVGVEIETGSNSYEQIAANIRKCVERYGCSVSFILDSSKAASVRKMAEGGRIAVVSDESMCISASIDFLLDKGSRGDTS